jgi:hypothetical protein
MLKLELQIKRANLTSRMHARLMRNINRRCMERQLYERVPLHFEMIAYAKYGARQRSAKYNQGKMRARFIGHIRPNVRTGFLKRSLRGKITATQHGSRLTMRASLNNKLPADEWAAMTPLQRNKWLRKNRRRLANWQKREIAVLAKDEIAYERKRQASEYRSGAMSSEYRRQRVRRIR